MALASPTATSGAELAVPVDQVTTLGWSRTPDRR